MGKVILAIALACGMGFSQTVKSKLNGKRIYLSRQEGGHQPGYDGFRTLMEANMTKYGFVFEYSPQPLGQAQLDAVYDRLYKPGVAKTANTIDILIFCQGEGDRNVAGNPYPGAPDRMAKVNAHVRNGGGLIAVHGAGGREVSWYNWSYGAMLMTDWFQDDYRASSQIPGNGGHFPSRTPATYTLDEETLPTKDSSTYFIRKLLLRNKTEGGFQQPLVTDQVRGEWYHYNAGKEFENGTGNNVNHSNNRWVPKVVRGNPGVPDSGIGPAKIIGILTQIRPSGGAYTPPGKGRHSVWGREVSKGVFDPAASTTNGRYVLFNPGHDNEEWTQGGGWMGDFFLSTLRWVVKDDRGCTDPSRSNYNALATVNDGTCTPTGLGKDALLMDAGSAMLGRLSVRGMSLDVTVEGKGSHTVAVTGIDGKSLFSARGEGGRTYQVPNLARGFYMAHVKVDGQAFKKLVSIQ